MSRALGLVCRDFSFVSRARAPRQFSRNVIRWHGRLVRCVALLVSCDGRRISCDAVLVQCRGRLVRCDAVLVSCGGRVIHGIFRGT